MTWKRGCYPQNRELTGMGKEEGQERVMGNEYNQSAIYIIQLIMYN